ncbi:MAG: M48 family metallopeptidase [Planctomycetota bacterium]|jgi:predicted Zn-dependent protease
MFKKIAISFLCLFLYFCIGCSINPITGEKQVMFFTEQQEIQIGQQYAPQIETQMGGRIQNEQIQNYINTVGQSLAKVSQRPDWQFHFAALNDKSTNAFALPGGYIFITRGMLEKLNSESQLAGILAHEIVHVVARHSTEQMSHQIGFDMLLSALASEDTSRAVVTVADLTWQVIGLKYSRDDEREADLAGLDYMVAADYNPYGMREVMQILLEMQKTTNIEFLSTHPSPENRLQYISDKIRIKYFNLNQMKIGNEDYQRIVLGNLTNLTVE